MRGLPFPKMSMEKTLMRTLVTAAIWAALPLGAAAQNMNTTSPTAGRPERTLDLEASAAALDKAISDKDRAALDRLLADDLLWIRGGGIAAGKAEFIAGLTSPSITIEPFVPQETKWFKSAETGMLTGVNVLRGRDGGVSFVDRHRFADYWIFRDGQWRLLYVQVTRLPALGR